MSIINFYMAESRATYFNRIRFALSTTIKELTDIPMAAIQGVSTPIIANGVTLKL